MAILSILNPKGGSGKTTISTNVASSLQRRGQRVLLVDSDPQGSARDWHATREDNPLNLIAMDRPNNVKNLPEIAGNYDFVVVDGAAKIEAMMAVCINVSDMILIPIQPSPYDIWAASDLVESIKTRQEITDGAPLAAFILSRIVEGTKLGGEVEGALNEFGLPVLKARIAQRQIYPQTAAEGVSVHDSGNAKAIAETEALTDEVLSMFLVLRKEVV